MNKEILLQGHTAAPEDRLAPDGNLTLALNLIPEDSVLRPLPPPSTLRPLPKGSTIAYIHKNSTFTHYIIYNADHTLYYINAGSHADPIPLTSPSQSIPGALHFNAIGNILLVFTQTDIHYFLWKDNAYTDLGTSIPEINLSFGLIGHPRLYSVSDESKSTFNITFDNIAETEIGNEFSDSNKTRITEQVMAKVNRFIRQQTIEKGRFCFPFFVRYALRLFDGSYIHQSAPILMNPSTTACPVVLWNHIKGEKSSYTNADLDIMLLAADLDFQVLLSSEISRLADWADLITSVDIFISKPIYTFDQEGQCKSWHDTDDFLTKFIGRLHYEARPSSEGLHTPVEDKLIGYINGQEHLATYAEWTYNEIYAMYFSTRRTYPAQTLRLPEFSGDKITESIRNTSLFYKLCSIPTQDIISGIGKRKQITIEDDYLQSLTERETLPDDYLSHDSLIARSSYVFNSRINLADISRRPFRGFTPDSMFAYCNGHCGYTITKDSETHSIMQLQPPSAQATDTSITIYIKENGTEYSLSTSADFSNLRLFMTKDFPTHQNFKTSWGCYVFYPNVNAHKMLITNSGIGSFLIDLHPHEFLNGSFALLDYETIRAINYTANSLPTVRPTRDNLIPQPNKVYTSQVNNPFHFPINAINTIGTGRILAITSAARALSQGQFGQFPLYAFTDEGVWALELSATGTYSARQPITRDVCTNPDGITQIDSSVLFPTDRGIMLISGSETHCISDPIKAIHPFAASTLPQLHNAITLKFPQSDTDQEGRPAPATTLAASLDPLPFLDYLRQCRMIYDYVNQRIHVYNPDTQYSYVYSLQSKAWGMSTANIADNVNSYPDALAIDTAGNLIDLSHPDTTQPINSLLLTRPISLNAPDTLKTIDTLLTRGNLHPDHAASILYGSRNLSDWHLLWSSRTTRLSNFRGTPWRHFRLALLLRLDPYEYLTNLSVQFTPRLNNRPR